MRRYVVNGGIVAISVMISLLVLEAGARLLNGVPLFTRTNFVADMLDLIRRNSQVLAYDETLGWRLADNYPGGLDFATGRYGVRMNSAEIKPPLERGILAVGDSFTAGSGVVNDQTWPAQLERMVGQPVANAASGAWGVDQMVLRVEQLIPALHPRTVIVGILAEDTLRNNFEIYGGAYKPYFAVEGGKAILKGVPVPHVSRDNLGLDLTRRIFGHSYLIRVVSLRLGVEARWIANEYRYRQIFPNETGVKISCALMDRLAKLRAEHGLRVIVLMQYGGPDSQDGPPWYGPPVVACAKERGLETVDSHPVLHDLSIREPQKFKDLWIDEGGQMGHMTAAGNKLIAQLLQQQMFKSVDH
jgi:hypothetical protein